VITIFACPKPFRGHEAVIQRNALRSWVERVPGAEVLLFGNEEGTAETAKEFGFSHVPDVARNALGTPLLSSVYAGAEGTARHPVLAYLNADVVLLGGLPEAVRLCGRFRRFLLVGRRTDLDVPDPIEFRDPDWDGKLRQRAQKEGSLHSVRGIDYVVFRKGTLGGIPPFALGRPAWDNWLVASARHRRFAVVDLTAAVMAVHQNHGYAHVKEGAGVKWEGREAEENRTLAGGRDCDLLDCSHLLAAGRVSVARTPEHVERRMWRLQRQRPALWRMLACWKLRHAACFLLPHVAFAPAGPAGRR
jgi:hypothetical protein